MPAAERTPPLAVSRGIVLGALLCLAAHSLVPWEVGGVRPALAATCAGLLALGVAMRAYAAALGGLVGFALLAPLLYPPLAYRWPLSSIATLVVYALVVRLVRPLRAEQRFMRRGEVDRTTKTLATAFVVMAAIALVVWRFASGADMTRYRAFIPAAVPTWGIFVAIVPYAMLNAIFEEVVWRGALWQGAEASFGKSGALVLTSLSFGIAHYHGFPSGVIGVGLAAIYGFMTGTVRLRTGGLFWPWLVHVFADVVIFTLVAAMVVA